MPEHIKAFNISLFYCVCTGNSVEIFLHSKFLFPDVKGKCSHTCIRCTYQDRLNVNDKTAKILNCVLECDRQKISFLIKTRLTTKCPHDF